MRRATLLAVVACLLCADLLACASGGGRRSYPRSRIHYSVGYGAGPYWGWQRPVIVVPPDIDGPDIDGPDIDYPVAVPLPEPPPDIGMPDMGDMGGMGGMDMDMGGYDF